MATARRTIPPPPLFPFAALVLGAALHFASLDLWTTPAWIRLAAALPIVAGLLLVAWGVRVQMRAGTDPSVWKDTTALVELGPYAWSRNPIYLGFLLMAAGVAVAADWSWGVVLTPVAGVALDGFVVRAEEADLSDRFGDDYAAYRGRVRRWL